jgi:CDP-diacylglycerol--glycerol-3-phosphate 3-phosphatidyltransferase
VTGETLDRHGEQTFAYGPGAILTPANAVTLLRLALAPVAFVMMLRDPDQSSWLLVAVWFVLSTSDLLDGTLARRYGTTRSGAFLDPLADKVLVIGGVGIMCWENRFPWVALVLIVAREIVISVFRATYVRRGLAVPASKLAKWKTFLQLGAVGWVTLPLTTHLGWLSNLTLWLGVAVGLVSGAQYLIAGSRGATSMSR